MQILLFSNSPDDHEFFQTIAATLRFPLVKVSNVDQYCDALKKIQSISIVDASSEALYKNFETAVAEKIGLFSESLEPNRLFFVSTEEVVNLPYLYQSGIFGHFITRTYNDENRAIVSKLIKLAGTNRAFGVENYFEPGVKTQTIPLTQSQQKLPIVESVKTYLLKAGFKSRAAAMISTALDEVLMNAIYDAPVDELGKQIYATTPRTVPLELTGKNTVELKIAFDGHLLALSVVDHYGSVDKKTLLEHIGRSYENTEYKVRVTKAGAGLGLSNVYRGCGGMIFACEIGHKTEVTLFFKKTDSFKDFKDQFRFLSTFMYLS